MQDLRLAIRALSASPVITAIAVVSLALGIGASAAIFSLVSSLLLRSLPVVVPERPAMLSTSASQGLRQQYSYATLDQIRQHRDIFDGALGHTDGTPVADRERAPGTSAPSDAERISQADTVTPGWMAADGTSIREDRDFDLN